MALIDDIRDHLADVTGLKDVARVFAANALREDPDVQVAVGQYGGQPADLGFGVPGVAFIHPGVQLLARATKRDSRTSEALCWLAYNAVAALQAVTIGASQIMIARPVNAPFEREKDPNERVVYACNFIVEVKVA